MNYYILPPPHELAKYVQYFWVLESDQPYQHRSMASGCAEILFHYQGAFDEILSTDRVEKSFISGIHGPS